MSPEPPSNGSLLAQQIVTGIEPLQSPLCLQTSDSVALSVSLHSACRSPLSANRVWLVSSWCKAFFAYRLWFSCTEFISGFCLQKLVVSRLWLATKFIAAFSTPLFSLSSQGSAELLYYPSNYRLLSAVLARYMSPLTSTGYTLSRYEDSIFYTSDSAECIPATSPRKVSTRNLYSGRLLISWLECSVRTAHTTPCPPVLRSPIVGYSSAVNVGRIWLPLFAEIPPSWESAPSGRSAYLPSQCR